MATRNAFPSMRDRDVQFSRPSTRTNGYRAPFLIPTPSILAKRTISQDCTQGPESERPRKYHCLQKEAERRAIPRLDHLRKPVAGSSTGLSSASPFTTSVKPLNPISIPGDTTPDLAPPPLPPPSRISDLENGYEAGWECANPLLRFVTRDPAFDPTSGLRPMDPRSVSTEKGEASEKTGHGDDILPSYNVPMYHSSENEEGNEALRHPFGNSSWPNDAGDSQRAPGKNRVFECRLCPERPQMKYKGSFRRHIQNKHYPTQYYRCPDCSAVPVETLFTRRDRLQHHMRHEHGYRLRNEEINRITLAVDPPLECALCASPTSSWNEHFECLCRHCLVSKADNGDVDHSEGDDGEEVTLENLRPGNSPIMQTVITGTKNATHHKYIEQKDASAGPKHGG